MPEKLQSKTLCELKTTSFFTCLQTKYRSIGLIMSLQCFLIVSWKLRCGNRLLNKTTSSCKNTCRSLLPYFGLTDLLTDDLELSVIRIPSPPLIKFASNTFKTMLTNLEEQLLNGGVEEVGYYISQIQTDDLQQRFEVRKLQILRRSTSTFFFNYELLLKSQYKK